MPLEKIDDTDVINVGHLSAENKNTKLSLFDRLPVGSIWSQTTIYISHDKADEYLEKIKNSSIGDDTKSEQNSDDAQSAKIKAAKGDYIVRYTAGNLSNNDNFVFLFSALKCPTLITSVSSIFSNGI
jgi:hypothetical protein